MSATMGFGGTPDAGMSRRVWTAPSLSASNAPRGTAASASNGPRSARSARTRSAPTCPYGSDPRETERYDLVGKTGTMDLDICVEIIVEAARVEVGLHGATAS